MEPSRAQTTNHGENPELPGVEPPNPDLRGVDPRRLMGRYYTPDDLAEMLVRWALTDVTGTVLDPSYGGCAFLNAAARVLSANGIENPGGLLYGVDVDPACTDSARRSPPLIEAHCITADFLGTSPTDVPGAPFAAVVGNPPYVRHHWLKGTQRERARAVAVDSAVPLPATASMWAYFLVHSLNFLDRGGRLAMLVPEAILQAQYAAPLREALSRRFSRCLLIHIRERLFDGTDEAVVVVSASGYGEPGHVSLDAIDRPEDLAPALADFETGQRASGVAVVNGRRTTEPVLRTLEEIERTTVVRPLSELAEIRIGLVTGANRHFIRSRQDLDELDLPASAVHPVVRRTAWLAGLDFTRDDHEELAVAGAEAFLVRPTRSQDQHAGVRRWLADGLEHGVNLGFKCAARRDWFRMALPAAPDAFATCSRLGAPRLVLNRTPHRCTNALHTVRWRPHVAAAPEAVAVGFLTTAVALWAELLGRRYGGGVLKIEPGTMNRMPIPIVPGAEDTFSDLNRLLRTGQEQAARELADRRILRDSLGLPEDQYRTLLEAHAKLMTQRRPVRNRGGHARFHR